MPENRKLKQRRPDGDGNGNVIYGEIFYGSARKRKAILRHALTCSRKPKISSFHVVVLHRTAKKCTKLKLCKTHVQSDCCNV